MHTLQPGDIFADNYRLICLVDTGGFAEVWKAEFIRAGNIVALKIFPRLDEEGIKNIEAEYRDQTGLLHTSLITSRNFGVYDGHPYLEMLFFDGGNGARKIGKYTESELAKCLYQIAGALTYLHAKEIVHQDIKPNNFLLDNESNYYLADLGLSVRIRQTIQRYTETKQRQNSAVPKNTNGLTPPCYRGPELYENQHISRPPVKATDVWSLGASLFEMATGNVPFGDMGGMLQKNDPSTPDLPASFTKEFNEIIKKCLAKETWDRPRASELEDWAGNYIKKGVWPAINTDSGPTPTLTPPKPNRWNKILVYVLIAGIITAGVTYFLRLPAAAVSNTISSDSSQQHQEKTPKKDSVNYKKTEDKKPAKKDSVVQKPIHKEKTPTLDEIVITEHSPSDDDQDGVPDNKDECPKTKKGDRVNANGCSFKQKPKEQEVTNN